MLDREALSEIGIDAEEGISYCADDEEFYEEMLLEYLSDTDVRSEDLKRFYDERNWPQYGICVHSIKSTSRMIGAKAVSEHAREMELLAKESDEAAIVVRHERFMAEYLGLAERLRALVSAER